jgi:hypothetical protein
MSRAEWRTVARALWLLWTIRIALAFVPVRRVRAWLARHPGAAGADGPAPDVLDRAVWSVGAARRLAPGATCLIQALALEALLARAGQPARLCVGVAREPGGPLQAHAWLEASGRILLGGTRAAIARYARLLDLPAPR